MIYVNCLKGLNRILNAISSPVEKVYCFKSKDTWMIKELGIFVRSLLR